MQVTTRKNASPARALLAGLAAALLALAACPALARADEVADAATADGADAVALTDEAANAVAYADNDGHRTYYTSIDEAIKAACYGATIVMNQDWYLTETNGIELDDGAVVTINMNGYMIKQTCEKGRAFNLGADAKLTLTSSTTRWHMYSGWYLGTDSWINITEDLGGLITGCYSQRAAIFMGHRSTLTLDRGVALAGNRFNNDSETYGAGGIYATEGSTINLTNGASIKHNEGKAGGIYAYGQDVTINIDNASIDGNGSTLYGGGIYSDADATRITMKNGGKIVNNMSRRGGGVCFNKSYFAIQSDDGTGEIGSNKAASESGGGIYVESERYSTHCSIRGINIHDNSASEDGGGVYLNQDRTHLIDCKIQNNTASKNGGGVYVNNKNCSIQGCTITGNSCNKAYKDYEGGGVFVSYKYDLELTGTCTIKDNKRVYYDDEKWQDPYTADDLFLSTISGETGYAYITGGVDAGSKVGIRTGIVGKDRMIGKDISTYTEGTYFNDLDNYYVTHGSDHNGDLWQRYGASTGFQVKVNGTDQTRYKWNETATADGISTTAGKHFWYWDVAACTGFSPLGDYINDTNKYDEKLTFTMPQNDVSLTAVYVDCATKLLVGIDKPVAGQELPTYAVLRRMDGVSGVVAELDKVPVTWYKVEDNGQKTAVTGKADYEQLYVAEINLDAQPSLGLFFSEGLTEKDVTVRTTQDGADAVSDSNALYASVDGNGKLTVGAAQWITEQRPHYTITVERPVVGQEMPYTAEICRDGTDSVVTVRARWVAEDGSTPTVATEGARYRLYFLVYTREDESFDFPEDFNGDDFEVVYADAPDAGPFPVQDAHIDDNCRLNVTTDWIDAIVSTPQHGGGDGLAYDESEGETSTAGETGDGSGSESGVPNTGDASGNPVPLAAAGAGLALAVGVALHRREQ